MPLGPSASYLAQFNGMILPGYVQHESFDSPMNVAQHQAPYAHGSLSENVGLQNKLLSLTMKVWEQDYLTCKTQVALAATIVHSKNEGFAPLYVGYTDRYYLALTKDINAEKEVGASTRTLDYALSFECKPWLYSTSGYTVSGVAFFDTDQVGRTIADGGWTPVTITATGTNITVSGYNQFGESAGYFSASGVMQNLIINSDAFTATVSGVNVNDKMLTADYRIYAGPAKTYYVVTGATKCSITYNNRWLL